MTSPERGGPSTAGPFNKFRRTSTQNFRPTGRDRVSQIGLETFQSDSGSSLNRVSQLGAETYVSDSSTSLNRISQLGVETWRPSLPNGVNVITQIGLETWRSTSSIIPKGRSFGQII